MKQPPIKRPLVAGRPCPACDQGKLERQVGPHTFRYKGHSKTVQTEQFHCPHCGESFYDDIAIRQFEPELKEWREAINMQTQQS